MGAITEILGKQGRYFAQSSAHRKRSVCACGSVGGGGIYIQLLMFVTGTEKDNTGLFARVVSFMYQNISGSGSEHLYKPHV